MQATAIVHGCMNGWKVRSMDGVLCVLGSRVLIPDEGGIDYEQLVQMSGVMRKTFVIRPDLFSHKLHGGRRNRDFYTRLGAAVEVQIFFPNSEGRIRPGLLELVSII